MRHDRNLALQAERATVAPLAEQVGQLTREVAAHCPYALNAIDEVRGETRT